MKKIFCLIIFLFLVISVSQAFAADPTIDSTIEFASNIASFSDDTAEVILKIARNLFVGLASLSLILGLIRMMLRGESTLSAVIAHLAKWILYTGIFTWMMSSLAAASFIPKIIINSFIAIAGKMKGSVEIAPDDILAAGIRIYGIIVEKGWNAGWGDFIGITFIGIIILVVMAMIAGFIAVAIIEMHLVICGGAVLLGFGGFEYTRNIALSYIRYAISVGMKLLMITIVYFLTATLLPQWEESFTNSKDMSALITGAGQILGATICILIIVRVIPNIAQSIVNNASMSFGNNAPIVGHSSRVETWTVPAPWTSMGSSFVNSAANAFRGSGSYGTVANNTQAAAYTPRADEVMTGGTGFNPTQIAGSTRQANEAAEARPETFEHYVAPQPQRAIPQVNQPSVQMSQPNTSFNTGGNRMNVNQRSKPEGVNSRIRNNNSK